MMKKAITRLRRPTKAKRKKRTLMKSKEWMMMGRSLNLLILR